MYRNLTGKRIGRKLEAFLDNLCGSLVDMAEKTDWEAFGKGVGDMLTQVDWLGHLKQVIKAVVESLGACLMAWSERNSR